MYVTVFSNTKELNESKLFELLQDALSKTLKGVTFNDIETILDIKNKIKAVSTEGGSYCPMCGHIRKMPGAGASFHRALNDGVYELKWAAAEKAKIDEALDAYPKNYDMAEDTIALMRKFKDAKKEEPKKESEPAA